MYKIFLKNEFYKNYDLREYNLKVVIQADNVWQKLSHLWNCHTIPLYSVHKYFSEVTSKSLSFQIEHVEKCFMSYNNKV